MNLKSLRPHPLGVDLPLEGTRKGPGTDEERTRKGLLTDQERTKKGPGKDQEWTRNGRKPEGRWKPNGRRLGRKRKKMRAKGKESAPPVAQRANSSGSILSPL